MNRRSVIATHHKTGTAWMSMVFRAIAEKLAIRFAETTEENFPTPESLPLPAIVFDDHSAFKNHQWMLADPEIRILHVIRDPRDVIISGMHYHRSADESWLRKPKEEFGGLTYQQKLNSFGNDIDRYSFEMDQSGGETITELINWDYTLPQSLEYKYEDLIEDSDMILFTKAAIHLGFEPHELEECRRQYWDQSLFGKKRSGGQHIRSGKTEQWRHVFDATLAAKFVTNFGTVLQELGYETDDSWAKEL
jgi:hypothetical protein